MNEHLHKKLDKLIKQRSLLKRQIKNRHRYSKGDLRWKLRPNWNPAKDLEEKFDEIVEEIRCIEKNLGEESSDWRCK